MTINSILIKNSRIAKGISIRKAAYDIDISETSLFVLEYNPKANCKIGLLRKISEYYKIPFCQMFKEEIKK